MNEECLHQNEDNCQYSIIHNKKKINFNINGMQNTILDGEERGLFIHYENISSFLRNIKEYPKTKNLEIAIKNNYYILFDCY